ncbi:Regulatory cys-3 [Lecanosticta acicola]|uniref:Regulatory cys-3 n=1 Tax=Lecanosticta acicola TaxID=111012 RepID=A0AAI9EAK9_9PEZI|nr:Regulatory cys-3 [Lecanosticta acicola]
MSGFHARRAPNVSQYLHNLNQIPGPQDLQQDDFSGLDSNLDLLTNTDFFDLDAFQPQFEEGNNAKNGAHFGFNDFQSFPGTNATSPINGTPSPTALQGRYPPQPQHFSQSPQSQHFSQSPQTGDKRKASVAMQSAADLEEASRLAAEEDKRRRNTAASARFRVKKKQREQALEKQAKDMSDKVSLLEGKVQQLEMENKWLKELITEKSDVKTLDAALNLKREKESEERSSENRTDGVGTVGMGEEGEA